MYRRPTGSDGNCAEDRFVYRPSSRFLNSNRDISPRGASSKLQDHEDDVFIRSRTFQNSNWRQPLTEAKENSNEIWDSSQELSRRDMSVVNNFMPHFSKTNYKPTTSAVDNLTPKFVQMHLNPEATASKGQNHGESRAVRQEGSWRNSSSSTSRTSFLTEGTKNIKHKLHNGLKLSARDKSTLIEQGSHLLTMLQSKSSLYDTLNKLDCITAKVKIEHFDREEQARDHLKQEMIKQYPESSVIPYGIRLLGLAHPETAMYMFFDPGNRYHVSSHHDKHYQYEVQEAIYEQMKKCGHNSDVLSWAAQELVTFTHLESNVRCVISFSNGFKHQNTLLLRAYLNLDKRMRLLLLLINDMVYKYYDLSKFLTTYALSIMVIMFLQKRISLPTLSQLRTSASCEKMIIGAFDCSFPHEISGYHLSSNQESTEQLLKGFCEFFKNFNFDEDIVSIIGPQLKKKMFCPPYEIMECTDATILSYINALKYDKIVNMKTDQAVIVQDPFELNLNAAEKVNSTVLEVFKMMCQEAYSILSKWC